MDDRFSILGMQLINVFTKFLLYHTETIYYSRGILLSMTCPLNTWPKKLRFNVTSLI